MFRILTVAIMMVFVSFGAQAQGLNPYLETLNDYNDIKPLQNPNWERSSKTMKSRILDRKNKVVGELNDIIVSSEGAIDSLNVELDRLQLGEINLNYSNLDIRASSRSYVLGYEDDQIEDVFPELLANIETASGAMSDSISVDTLIGSNVVALDGRRIGKVEEVMFSERGDRAEALLVRVNHKTVRGESVAIPFSSVEYIPSGSRFEVKVPDARADAILQYAEDM